MFVVMMGVLGRMSGNGFGQKWNVAWLPEFLYALPFGIAVFFASGSFLLSLLSVAISYAGMQSATWYFLRWQTHDDPNTTRGGTLKPVVDFIAGQFGYHLGSEGYAWVGAAVKGFIIGLPVGGVLTALLWATSYEIGSHTQGKNAVSEFLSAAGGGISIIFFLVITGVI